MHNPASQARQSCFSSQAIPLLKPGKLADQGKSYHPIALLSPVAKLVKKLLLPRLQEHLPLANHQHGFRSGHSTTTALNCITHKISTGLNCPKPCERTVFVALDLMSAFDTVSQEVLLGNIYNTNAPNYIKKWLTTYINGRSIYVEFRGKTSKKRKVWQGVLQGGVLSQALFNSYMSSLPAPQDNVTLISYADDITIMSSVVQPEQVCTAINNYLVQLATWLEQCSLILSMGKSSATLFITWTKQLKTLLNISVAGAALPTCPTVKVLGVMFDGLLTFSHHAKRTQAKVGQCNNILKKLAGTSWG